jgi:hypothetical protein
LYESVVFARFEAISTVKSPPAGLHAKVVREMRYIAKTKDQQFEELAIGRREVIAL